jgi:hypothetical protein
MAWLAKEQGQNEQECLGGAAGPSFFRPAGLADSFSLRMGGMIVIATAGETFQQRHSR